MSQGQCWSKCVRDSLKTYVTPSQSVECVNVCYLSNVNSVEHYWLSIVDGLENFGDFIKRRSLGRFFGPTLLHQSKDVWMDPEWLMLGQLRSVERNDAVFDSLHDHCNIQRPLQHSTTTATFNNHCDIQRPLQHSTTTATFNDHTLLASRSTSGRLDKMVWKPCPLFLHTLLRPFIKRKIFLRCLNRVFKYPRFVPFVVRYRASSVTHKSAITDHAVKETMWLTGKGLRWSRGRKTDRQGGSRRRCVSGRQGIPWTGTQGAFN